MTDFQTAARDAENLVHFIDRMRAGAEALRTVADIENTITEKRRDLNAIASGIQTSRATAASLEAQIEVLKATHADWVAQTQTAQAKLDKARAAIAKLREA